jgi:hypothetical protein
MADYDWGPACGCGFMQPHRNFCKSNPQYEFNVHRREEKEKRANQGYGCIDYSKNLWSCSRCGTVVWNPDKHSQFFADHPDTQHPSDKIKETILNG